MPLATCHLCGHLLGKKHRAHAQASAQHHVRHGNEGLSALHKVYAFQRKR